MTPEQKELKIEAYSAWLDDCGVALEIAQIGAPKHWKPIIDPTGEIFGYGGCIRLAPPAEIPWHNPEGVTQEQLEPEKGWRFLVPEELDGRFETPEQRKIGNVQYWIASMQKWGRGEINGLNASEIKSTYRIFNEPLPEKYQHLVPERNKLAELEEKDARAYSLFSDLRAPEGYGEPEFLGSGPVDIEDGFMYANIVKDSSRPTWKWQYGLNGKSAGCFYARARKLPTEKERAIQLLDDDKYEYAGMGISGLQPFLYWYPDMNHWQQGAHDSSGHEFCHYARLKQTEKEKAEAALNAYKLEPGDRLGKIYEGDGIEGSHSRPYLHYSPTYGNVVRHFGRPANIGGYYAEIIKEPELVPFTQETFPLGNVWIRSRKYPNSKFLVTSISYHGVNCDYRDNLQWDMLYAYWEICTDGTTWTRAGKGVGA